ncbi:hypothetical protein BGX34_003719 [Mortierella sp. NVP85]|nr:hypothetical protein BGX34_003719 [Mortierella sp. NVP85]
MIVDDDLYDHIYHSDDEVIDVNDSDNVDDSGSNGCPEHDQIDEDEDEDVNIDSNSRRSPGRSTTMYQRLALSLPQQDEDFTSHSNQYEDHDNPIYDNDDDEMVYGGAMGGTDDEDGMGEYILPHCMTETDLHGESSAGHRSPVS